MLNEKRLIDGNVLEQLRYTHIVQFWDGKLIKSLPMAEAPTVDAVEVVHGRWEKASETMPIYKCSVCGERNLFKSGNNVLSNYCHSCGADMRGNDNG